MQTILYEVDEIILYDNKSYLIVQIINLDNYTALLCQEDQTGKYRTIEIPTKYNK